MAALGRILQIIGWLWFAAGFLGPLVGFDGVNLFPGLILVFVARAIRTQAARHAPSEPDEVDREEEPRPERVLNTERVPRTPPPPAPDPIVRYQRAEAQTTMDEDDEEDDPDSGERDNLIERIALAGRETTTTSESAADRSGGSTLESDRHAVAPRRKPMTSAEMLAQAHKRWDRKR
ncbi:MAG TPA: hypothetical protein VMM14_01915 [Acidimicrobiia bacterium]|nr:hypothetical protein [Acidimicrobiia bacterium]